MKKRRLNDIILIAILLFVAAAGFLLFFLLSRDGDTVIVVVDGKESASYLLSADIRTVIKTDYGTNTLVINDGKAYIEEADCPDGICAAHKAISKDGEAIFCLPHKLAVKVKAASGKKTLDVAP